MTDPTGSSGRLLAVVDSQLNAILGNAHAPTPVPAGTGQEISDVVCEAGIASHLELAHFIGQFAYECAYFRQYEEPASAGAAYEMRASLGNTTPGDGVRYRGRGACQLTGRANYRAFNDWLQGNSGLHLDAPWDIMATPDILNAAPYRWLAAAWFWKSHPLLQRFAQNDDVAGCTRVITGARIPGDGQGLAMRERLTDAAIMVLG